MKIRKLSSNVDNDIIDYEKSSERGGSSDFIEDLRKMFKNRVRARRIQKIIRIYIQKDEK